MPRGDRPALAALDIADDPAVWIALGFAVDGGGRTRVGDVDLVLTGSGGGAGITAWGLAAATPLPPRVDGIATRAAQLPQGPPPIHPNGAVRLDHLVVATPDVDRTLAALTSAGLTISRERDTGLPGPRARQAFLWSGDVILEVAGPAAPAGDDPASLWGLVVVTADIDALPARTDQLVGTIRSAVQPGRRIAPVSRGAGSSVPLAFMTPHRGADHDQEHPTA